MAKKTDKVQDKVPTSKTSKMRRFNLVRTEDASGVSGTGIVAEGVEFSNGQACMRWLSQLSAVAIYDNIRVLEEIHGHEGRTEIKWIDEE